MMLRQSPFRWFVWAGVMLFVFGLLLDLLFSKKGNVHAVLGMPVSQAQCKGKWNSEDSIPLPLSFSLTIDSIQVGNYQPEYELQVREVNQEFSQSIHTGMTPSSFLIEGFPLTVMEIRKIPETEYRFRLKQFYPDFEFQYNYPENRDTIPPNAPGITLQLLNSEKEEVITLRSDKSNLQHIDDVVGLGCSLHFYWSLSKDTLHNITALAIHPGNKIVLVGKEKMIFFWFNNQLDSMPLENKFYSLPGKDSVGFTILQCFPDAKFLKATPGTRSNQLINPVAEVEVWKLGEGAQTLFLYPTTAGRHGGEWKIPGKNFLLTCSLDHCTIIHACQYNINFQDSTRKISVSNHVNGTAITSFRGMKVQLTECDPSGIWINCRVWSNMGIYFKWPGLALVLVSVLIMGVKGSRKEQSFQRA